MYFIVVLVSKSAYAICILFWVLTYFTYSLCILLFHASMRVSLHHAQYAYHCIMHAICTLLDYVCNMHFIALCMLYALYCIMLAECILLHFAYCI